MTSPLSPKARALEPSATLAMAARAKQLAAEGKDVVSFTVGEPDFKTPAHICAAAKKAVDDGLHGYTPSNGLPALLKAVADHFRKTTGVVYEPSRIVVSPGAKFSIYLALQVLTSAGDEVLIPAPYWVSYPEMARLAGATPVALPTREDRDFALTADALEAAITPRTKLLILNTPSNPTGGVIPAGEIEKIARVLQKHNVWCLADEIYDQLAYGAEKPLSIASISDWNRDHSVVINGASKTYAMTGWRVGWAAGPAEVVKAMGDWQSQSTSNACAIAQAAAIAALTGPQECVAEMRAEFAARADVMARLLNDIPGVTCRRPTGAFYALPNISKLFGRKLGGRLVNNPTDFCNAALDACHVAMVAGETFGAPDHVRISYACSRERIEEGCRRLRDLVGRGATRE